LEILKIWMFCRFSHWRTCRTHSVAYHLGTKRLIIISRSWKFQGFRKNWTFWRG
jgi:hypothetical protein